MPWHMGTTFAQKFEEAVQERRQREPGWGLKTLARQLAKDDPEKTEIIRRRLNKYRPKNGGGAAEVVPTEPTRREIERAMGLSVDALEPEFESAAARARDSSYAERLFVALDDILESRAHEIADRLAREREVVA